MNKNCGLCIAPREVYRVVQSIDSIAYAIIPITPMIEGHTMVLPAANKQMKDLSAVEMLAINQLLVYVKEKLVELYPSRPPLIATHSDTSHASIPEHFHYHIIPCGGNLEKIMSKYNPSIYKKEHQNCEELERRAVLLKS